MKPELQEHKRSLSTLAMPFLSLNLSPICHHILGLMAYLDSELTLKLLIL